MRDPSTCGFASLGDDYAYIAPEAFLSPPELYAPISIHFGPVIW